MPLKKVFNIDGFIVSSSSLNPVENVDAERPAGTDERDVLYESDLKESTEAEARIRPACVRLPFLLSFCG